MADESHPPIDFSPSPSITEDDAGRLTLHWPEGRRSVEISREMLQALVDRANGAPAVHSEVTDHPPEVT
jgi:hypothetical protein